MKLSIIIPVFNEQGNILPLFRLLKSGGVNNRQEIIFVNDGSTDNTEKEINQCKGVTLICLRRNFGQTAALAAGVSQARGEVIVTLDGDGQNDSRDIAKLINKLDEGYDVVCGWRRYRKDSWGKRVISSGADRLRKLLLRDKIHDSGCGLKAYRRECLEGLDLYGEMHRFIPAILSWKGFRVTEVIVRHHRRSHGKSKYKLVRTIKGFVDMVNVWFWYKFSARPLHLFGGLGLCLISIGGLLLVYLTYIRLFLSVGLSDKIWPLVSFFLIIAGVQLFVSGIVADILIKIYFNLPKKSVYSVEKIIKVK